MKNYTLYWYYRSKICQLNRDIERIRSNYAQRSHMSSRNFEFDSLVESNDTVLKKREEIYNLKRKICVIK